MRTSTKILLVFCAAFLFRAAVYFAFRNYGTIPPREMERVAGCFAETGSFCNPYATPTGPTAHVGPLYPILLGSIYRVFGPFTPSAMLGQAMLSWIFCALRCALLIPLATVLRLPCRAGTIAAILGIFFIGAFNTELRGGWDAPLIALCLMAIVWAAARFSGPSDFRPASALLLGLAAGVILLINPAPLPVIAAYCLLGACAFWPGFARYALSLAAFILGIVIVLTPWTLRNLYVLGNPMPFRSNFGLELFLAYNETGAASTLDLDIARLHPALNVEASRQLAAMGEVEFHRRKEHEALDYIRNHPATAARIFAAHIVYFWFPPADNLIFRLLLAGLTITSAIGLILLWRENPRAGVLIAVVWIAFPLVYYITIWSSRYRYPMEWTMLLATAALLDRLGRHFLATKNSSFESN
jgi:hypothetical protein